MSDWDEVKRLAADFQKAQLTSTLQKLSEHNCVEIVTLLLQKNLIDVVFTTDGKEYVTPEHLVREVNDELYVSGGRVNLTDVSKTLNIDLSKIEEIANNITADDPSINLILGQLISEDYITYIAQEINEKLSQKGEISVNDLTEQFNLPSDFLQHNVLEKNLGKIIKARQDPANPKVFFTQAYLQRCKAKIRGVLTAITRPTNVSVILQQINIQQKMFHTLVDEINPAGSITSKLANAQYVPHIYAKMQSDWVTNFYRQNGFLEYDSVNKLGITNAKQYITKQFADEELIFLKRCAVSSKLIELTVMPALAAAKQYIDLSSLLPSNMSSNDREELFNTIMSSKANAFANFILVGSDTGSASVVFTPQYLDELVQPCREMAIAKAKTAVDTGAYQQYIAMKQTAGKSGRKEDDDDDKLDKRDERRKKAASGKAGGGSQGRETKTKSTKKHARGGKKGKNDFDSDDDFDDGHVGSGNSGGSASKKQLQLVTINDVVEILNKETSALGLDELNEDIAGMYLEQLNQTALQKAQELYEISLQKNAAGSGQTHGGVQEKINVYLVDLRLYEKGLKLFPANVQPELVKYLVKSLGNDICTELILYIANECQIEVKNPNLNVDQRNKLAQECGGDYKTALLELNKSLNKSIDDLVLATEAVLKSCSMIVKKADKKKDRQLILNHREKLIEQLQQCSEPALILHLTALILFVTITQSILHASGKFVSQILAYIKPSMSDEQNELLAKYHDLVISILRLSPDSEEYTNASNSLQDFEPKIKQLAVLYEKPGTIKAD